MRGQVRGMIITTFGASMWGFCAVAGKYVMGTKGVDPVWMVTLRLICAGLILLSIGFYKEKGKGLFEIWKDKASVLRLLVVAIFAFAVCQTTYFAAGFIYALSCGYSLEDCGKFACATASCAVEVIGATEGVKSVDKPRARYEFLRKR